MWFYGLMARIFKEEKIFGGSCNEINKDKEDEDSIGLEGI